MIIIRTLAPLFMTMLVATGCTKARMHQYPLIGCMSGPMQAVNIAYTRATEWHLWADPCEASFGPVVVNTLQLVVPNEMTLACTDDEDIRMGKVLPIVKHVRGGNWLLAPNMNPLVLSDWSDSMWEFFQTEDARFSQQYEYCAVLQRQRRIDARFAESDRTWRVQFHRLPQSAVDVEAGLQVDHTFLFYILQNQEFWSQIVHWWDDGTFTQEIRILCEAVTAMDKAHQLQWPGYRWSDQHERRLRWCETVASH